MLRLTGQRSYGQLFLEFFLLFSTSAFKVDGQTVTTPPLPFSTVAQQPPSPSSTGGDISPTPTTSISRYSTVASPQSSRNHSFQVIIEFLKISWKNDFLDRESLAFKALERNVSGAVKSVFTSDEIKVEILEFKPGSILAFLNLTTDSGVDEVKERLVNETRNGTIGGFLVFPKLFTASLSDVVLKIKVSCNDSVNDKEFNSVESLLNTVQMELPRNSISTIRKISCPDPGNVTIVTLRVEIEKSTSENPNEELKGLRSKVITGQVGHNFSVVPDWRAYIPGNKLFFATFELQSATPNVSQTRADLEVEIKELFGNERSFKYATVEMKNNKSVVVEVGMHTSASELPREALTPLIDSVNKEKSIGVFPVKAPLRFSVDPNTLTRKIVELHFHQKVVGCDVSQVNDSRYMAAEKAAVNFTSKLKQYKYFIAANLKSLKCVDGNTVYAVFVVTLTPNAPNVRKTLPGSLRFLRLCETDEAVYHYGVKIVSLTPTSFLKFNYVHYVCYKPKTTVVTAATEFPAPVPQPKLYVELRLGITWGEFCSKLDHSLKQKVAWNLHDKNGDLVSPDRIVFINVHKNCNDPTKKDDLAKVWFYVSKKSGSKDLDTCLTLKVYRLLRLFLENANTKHLGPDFEGKLIHVDLVGKNASKYKSKDDSGELSTLAIILIAIAGAVGLLLLTIACCCLFCCGASLRRKRKDEDSHHLRLVHIAESGTGESGEKVEGNERKRSNENDGNDKSSEVKQEGGARDFSYENKVYATVKDDRRGELNESSILQAPAILTSPAQPPGYAVHDVGAQASNSALSTPLGGSRRGSSSTGGEGQQGTGSTPRAFRHIDADTKDRERRRSSIPSIIDDADVPLTHKTGTVGIVALALRNRNEKKKEAEFKNLNKDVPEEEMKYPASTLSKNRSPDVLPASKTRVKLSSSPDYINANWIRDHEGKKCYIATQHPLHETVEDFWRMIWEQQAHLVVMVNDEEREKTADFMDYLPRGEGNAKNFGAFSVAIKQIVQKADYTLTVLSLGDSKKPSSAREVSHMRFTSWKERAVPNVALFVGFVTATREVRRKKGDSKAPTVVHCSDGLGFSGVFIAVDIGIKSHEESKTSVVDVFELSKNLRRDRHGIVCSLDHYNFIYQALYEYTVNYDESAETQKL